MWIKVDPIRKDPFSFAGFLSSFCSTTYPYYRSVIPFAIMVWASLRSTTFLLVFILLPLIFSSAHTQNQGKKTVVVTNTETTRSQVDLEVYHGGRKMMSREVQSKLKVKVAENGSNAAKGLTTERKEVLNVKQYKVGKRNINGHSGKVNMSGLVPLNADYYVPRPHPPKNN